MAKAKHADLTLRPAERLVRERRAITGLSRTRWYLLEQEGRAPRRLQIDTRTVARLSDLERWVAAKIAETA